MIDPDRVRADNDRMFAGRLAELRSEHARLLDEADRIAAKHPVPNSGQQQRITNLLAGARKVSDELAEVATERNARLDTCLSLAEAAQNPARLEPAVGPLYGEAGFNIGRSTSPWETTAVRPEDTRGQALRAIELDTYSTDSGRQRATVALERADTIDAGPLAAWATRTSDPAYLTAFH